MPNYPVSLDDDVSLFLAVNNKRTTLTSSISDSDLTIPVVTTSGFPDTGFITILSNPDDITLAEAISYNSITPTQFNATVRGAGGTPNNNHNTQDNVDLTVMAEHHNEIKDAVIELEKFVGVSGSTNFVPKDAEGNVAITGTLTVDNLIDAGWLTTSGSLVVCGPAFFKDDVDMAQTLTVTGVAQFGEIPVSPFPDGVATSSGKGDFATSDTSWHTFLPGSAMGPGLNLLFYRGNAGWAGSSANTGGLEIRAMYQGSIVGFGDVSTTIQIGNEWGAEVAGFKVLTGDGVSAPRIEGRSINSASRVIQYGALDLVSLPLDAMGVSSGTDYWYINGSDTGNTDPTSSWVTAASLDFTAPDDGEYLILFTTEVGGDVEGRARFRVDSDVLMTQAEVGDTISFPAPGAVIRTLSAGAHTVDMQHQANNFAGGSVTTTRSRIFVVRTASFDQIHGVRSDASQSYTGFPFTKLNAYDLTYTPRQREQLFVIGVGGYSAVNDVTSAGYKLVNVTDGEEYCIDAGQGINNSTASPGDDVIYRPTMMFQLLDDVRGAKDFELHFHNSAFNGQTVINEDGSLIAWGLSPPIAGGNVPFTTINGNTVTTSKLNADCVAVSGELTAISGGFSQSLTVSGQPVATGTAGGGGGVTDHAALTSLDYASAGHTGFASEAELVSVSGHLQDQISDNIVAISGSFSQSLTVSGQPVSTGTGGGGSGNITDINSQVGPSITIVGTNGVQATTTTNQVDLSLDLTEGIALATASGVIARKLDLTHDPVGLWLFEGDLTDSSGNGATLDQSASLQEARHDNGLLAAYSDDSTRYVSAASQSQLVITGDVTLQVIVAITKFPVGDTEEPVTGFLKLGGSGETEPDNIVCLLGMDKNKQLYYFAEEGAGTDIDYANTGVILDTDTTYHIALVRENDDVTFYVNGVQFGSSSSGLNAPTGGGTTAARIGATDFGNDEVGEFTISCAKVIDSALTASQVYEEYSRTWALSLGILSDAETSGREQFRGVHLTTTTGIDISGTTGFGAGDFNFNNEVYDTDSFHESDFSTITIPSDATKARFSALVAWNDTSELGRRTLQVVKRTPHEVSVFNDSVAAVTAGGQTIQTFTTPVLPVSGGETYVLHGFYQSIVSTSLTINDAGFGLKIEEPVTVTGIGTIGSSASANNFVGAMINTSSGIDIPGDGNQYEVNWDTIKLDTDGQGGTSGFVDFDADDKAFVFQSEHESGFWVVKGQVVWEDVTDTDIRILTLTGPTLGSVRVSQHNVNDADEMYQNISTYPFQAPAGERIRMRLTNKSGSPVEARSLFSATWFSIERVGVSGTV
jgi:hypothetical protein